MCCSVELLIVACLGVASSEGDGRRRWNVSDKRVMMSVVSLPHAAGDSWLSFPIAVPLSDFFVALPLCKF